MKTFHRRASLFLIFLLGALALVPATPTSAQRLAGHLDGTFGTGGVVTLDVNGADDEAAAVLIQPDGKIVVAGRDGAFYSTFAVARYLTDGRLDPSFGEGGKARIAVQGTLSYATALALLPDGRLIVGGDTQFNDGSQQLALVRLNANGSLDPSFGKDGKVLGPLDTSFGRLNTHLSKVAAQSDGKLVVAGSQPSIFTGAPLLYRLLADGSLDLSFGRNGRAIFGGGEDLLIQPDGKIVTVSSSGVVNRVNPDGSPDQGAGSYFNYTGSVYPFDRFLALFDIARSSPAVALGPDGKLVLACTIKRPRTVSDDDFALLRLNPNGSLDESFGAGGPVIFDLAANDRVKDLLVQPDGKVLLAGYSGLDDPNSHLPVQAHVTLLRFNADGSLDQGFKIEPLPADPLGLGVANAMALQADGRIVVVGTLRNAGGSDMLVARYESGLVIVPPPPPPDFFVTAEPPTLTAARGSKVSFKIIINRIGDFHDGLFIAFPETTAPKVNITALGGSGDGVTFAYTVKIKGKSPPGTYPITVNVNDSTGRLRSATVTLIIT